MQSSDALAQLGVTADTLLPDEKSRLDRDGFLVLPAILSQSQVAAISARLDALSAAEGASAGLEVHQEPGTDRLSDLVNKDPLFDICYAHPRVLAGIAHVLRNDLKLSSLNARAALPGEGLQALHVDWGGPVSPDAFQVCNSIWLIDDFTIDNGATRVVPGSHLLQATPPQRMADPKAPHPDEIKLIAPAGTVVIFNSHTWHGGTRNTSAGRRRALHSYFCRRDQKQQLDQRHYIRPETLARISPAARFILDV